MSHARKFRKIQCSPFDLCSPSSVVFPIKLQRWGIHEDPSSGRRLDRLLQYPGKYSLRLHIPSIQKTQYYNQPSEPYGTLTLFSSPVFPGSGVSELISANIPAEKIVVGKPMSSSTPGYLDPQSLNDWILQAKSQHGWSESIITVQEPLNHILSDAGVMTWQYKDPEPDYNVVAWIQTVRSSAFPLKRELKRAISALLAAIR